MRKTKPKSKILFHLWCATWLVEFMMLMDIRPGAWMNHWDMVSVRSVPFMLIAGVNLDMV